MAEPIRRVLLKGFGRVRLYCPYGEIVPGMAYLVRRLLENTANQGFLRLMFAEETDAAALLRDPTEAAGEGQAARSQPGPGAGRSEEVPFGNYPSSNFADREERELFAKAIGSVRERRDMICPLFIDGNDRITEDVVASVNPADPKEEIAFVCQAGREEAEAAIGAAHRSFDTWRETEPSKRAGYLTRAAAWMAAHRHELAAWQVLEIGKQWDQASADVAEAIDFLEYYSREMARLGMPQKLAIAAR